MTCDTHKKQVLLEFPNVETWLEFVQSPSDEPVQESRRTDGSGWVGTRTFEEAVDLARNGWEDGVERIKKRSAEITDKIIRKLQIPELFYDVTGDALDIGRFVNGEPEDFMSVVPAEIDAEPKILHIVANISASSAVKSEALIARGAAIVSLVDALEAHGKRVIVDCISYISPTTKAFRKSENRLEVRVRVKDDNAPVQLANLVFLVAHPSALRRLMFASYERSAPHVRRMYVPGYGVPATLPDDRRGDLYVEGTLYVKGQAITSEGLERWVLEQLKQQGIIVEDDE